MILVILINTKCIIYELISHNNWLLTEGLAQKAKLLLHFFSSFIEKFNFIGVKHQVHMMAGWVAEN